MAYSSNRSNNKIPGWLIFVGFCIGFLPGGILLAIRMIQNASERDNGRPRVSDAEWERLRQRAAESSGQRTYDAQGRRTYSPNAGAYARRPEESGEDYARRISQANRTVQGQVNPDGTYRYVYRSGSDAAPEAARPAQHRSAPMEDRRLNPRRGKSLRLTGNILLGLGAFVTALTFLGGIAAAGWGLLDLAAVTSIVGLCCCTPGAVLSIVGSKLHSRVMRCRTYAAMIGSHTAVEIKKLAAAIPTRMDGCVKDLQWMISEGMLEGMYIDRRAKLLIRSGSTAPQPRPQEKPETPPATRKQEAASEEDGRFPEEKRIRQLNDEIMDEYVSRRMERLEELTHSILDYAREHPEKEPSLRQFRNHYLPKTLSILESYARMERMGVEGGNIGSAMKDVEGIMDKLVLGFEKQLDALFDSEALDVTTDISVLENMMQLEGLSDSDPFGTLRQEQ